MPQFQFIEKLLECPFFQGINKNDLHEIIGQTTFDFKKYEPGQIIVKAGTKCDGIVFVLNGTVSVTTESANHNYSVEEFISAPIQLQPERLFGLRQTYYSTFKAHTPCSTMFISKKEIVRLFHNYDVFSINLTNYYATGIQRLEDRQWSASSTSLRSHIIRFLTVHALHPAGEKKFKIKMSTLGGILNDSRLDISKELNKMQDEGLVNLSRGLIHIPMLEALFG